MKEQRHNEILRLLAQQRSIKTEALAAQLGVSLETVRRDIGALARSGHIRKVYGGITLASDTIHTTTLENWNVRLNSRREEKAQIALRALDYIEDGAMIALDIGTTTYQLSRLLSAKKDLSILTSSLQIAGELSRSTGHTVYCIGGVVLPGEDAAGGAFARDFLEHFASIDLFIGGADGLSLTCGVTECHASVVEVKQQLIRRARRNITLADHTKFGVEATFVSCPVAEMDVLITDTAAPAEDVEALRRRGVEVVTVPSAGAGD